MRASGGDESSQGLWKEAYDVELERNALLRERLKGDAAAQEPEACTIDWESNYQQLRECNEALERQLRAGAVGQKGVKSATEMELDSRLPVMMKVPLQDGREASLELFRLLGPESSFLAFRGPLPLGLRIFRQEKGGELRLRGAFIVEEVVEGGSAAAQGSVKVGDVVHALSVMDTSMGTSSFDSGVSTYTPRMVLTCFLSSIGDLIQAISSNDGKSEGNLVTLVLERSKAAVEAEQS